MVLLVLFFGYYMLYQKDINKICGGSGLPFLSYEQLDKIEVCYPKDIEEQIQISKNIQYTPLEYLLKRIIDEPSDFYRKISKKFTFFAKKYAFSSNCWLT